METAISGVAALAAAFFAIDLWQDHRHRPRPQIAAYATGMTMFAVATAALFIGLTWSWTGPGYRTFFLFGAVLNIPFLALGSMFLVVGRRSGHVMTVALGALAAISITLVATADFERPLPGGGIPHDMFATGFGPRLFAIIGGAAGGSILIALAVVSAVRFWRRDRRIVWGNMLIVAGVLAASWRGTLLALGEASGFALSLLAAVTFIWAGYRVASGRRSTPDVGHLDRDHQTGVGRADL